MPENVSTVVALEQPTSHTKWTYPYSSRRPSGLSAPSRLLVWALVEELKRSSLIKEQ